MSELQNKTVTMELNNHQLETIKCLFGHSDWEMKIIEQSAVVEGNGGNSHVQNNTDQSTQTNMTIQNLFYSTGHLTRGMPILFL